MKDEKSARSATGNAGKPAHVPMAEMLSGQDFAPRHKINGSPSGKTGFPTARIGYTMTNQMRRSGLPWLAR